jgi:N-methylhydantoinase A
MTKKSAARIGVDVGGTFTDVAAVGEDGVLRIGKQLTSVGDESEAIVKAAAESGVPLTGPGVILAHGTTLVINALLERRGARVALVATRGFADILELGYGSRPETFNAKYSRDAPLVPTELRFEISERVTGAGEVIERPSGTELDRLAREVAAADPKAIAVAFLNAHVDPANETLVADYLARRFPAIPVTWSSAISQRSKEYERFATSAANAHVLPVVKNYLGALTDSLESGGFTGEFVVLDSNGGALDVDLAARFPVRIIESGPVAGVVAARELAVELGVENVVTFDMGGTTAKSSVIENGEFPSTDVYWVGQYARGYPLQIPSVDIVEVGAGGGSIAWLDEGDRLRLGPRSASSWPGPACYGRGGTEPTVTDANLFCGRLPNDHFPDGLQMDREAASRAISRLAGRVGMPPVRLALGMLRLADISMAAAVRRQTLERGRDPRDFLLVASGGAGPMHACAVAAEVGIGEVLVPIHPGHFSAIGMLQADLRFERTRRILRPLASLDRAAFGSAVDELSHGVGKLLTASGTLDDVVFSYRVTLRYEGQFHSLSIALPSGKDGHGDIEAVQALFEKEYARRYGDYDRQTEIELVELQVQGARRLARPRIEPERGTADRTDAVIFAYFGLDEEPVPTSVVQRSAVLPGDALKGPCVVCETGATTVVPPGWHARVDERGNIKIRLGLEGA